MRMPGWYDISSFTDQAQKSADEAGILRSRAYVHGLITAEQAERGIAPSRIVLGGFSQGGALALLAGITSPVPLAGVFALSAYLLMPGKVPGLVAEAEKTTKVDKSMPIFMGHGDMEPLVRCDWGRDTAKQLTDWGWTHVDFRSYPGLVHSVDPDEMDRVEDFLNHCLPDV